MKNKVLLIGGTGYLGRHLKTVFADDFELFFTGTKLLEQDNYYRVDFNDPESYQVFRGKNFDVIIILAASIQGLKNKSLNNIDLEINTIKLASFLQFISEGNITSKLIYISSMTVYAPAIALPVDENSKLQPLSVYGLSKKLAESIVEFSTSSHDIKGLALRLPGIYGGDRKGGYIYNLVKKAKANELIEINTNGLGYWECIEIRDLCDLIKQIVKKYEWKDDYLNLNVGYGERTDFVDTARYIVKKVNSQSALVVGEPIGYSDFYMDNQRLLDIVELKSSFRSSLDKYISELEDEIYNR